MKHQIVGEYPMAGRERQLVVDLLPENSAERTAIANVEIAEASEDERELINNYLLLGLGYQVVDILRYQGRRVTLKIFR
jgi:hypothetical protein